MKISPLLIALSACFATPSVLACSACGCLLNSDWTSQGYRTNDGMSMDLRFDFSNQNQLRSGTGVVDRGAISYPNDAEIQRSTISRTTTLSLDYAAGDWGVNVKLPYLARTHDTIVDGDTDLSYSQSSSLGDLRIVGRYKGFAPNSRFGITFGVKLPTGSQSVNFSSGPQQDTPLDRGLQAGTGTADLLLGAFHADQYNESFGYFVQGDMQIPLNAKNDFKPGNQFSLSTGLRYTAKDAIQPQVQLNIRHETSESGLNADVGNSGFTAVHLSPGVNIQVSKNMAAYAFLQVPIYQKVNGLQLEPRYNISFGAHYSF